MAPYCILHQGSNKRRGQFWHIKKSANLTQDRFPFWARWIYHSLNLMLKMANQIMPSQCPCIQFKTMENRKRKKTEIRFLSKLAKTEPVSIKGIGNWSMLGVTGLIAVLSQDRWARYGVACNSNFCQFDSDVNRWRHANVCMEPWRGNHGSCAWQFHLVVWHGVGHGVLVSINFNNCFHFGKYVPTFVVFYDADCFVTNLEWLHLNWLFWTWA